jgi:integrase
VPLSKQALAVIEAMRPLSGDREKTPSTAPWPAWASRVSPPARGLRALFSAVANEAGHDADVIERQLAHIERNKERAAYHRAEVLAERAALIQWWADDLDGRRGGKVVAIGRKASA